MRFLILIFHLIVFTTKSNAQNFVNNDLEGVAGTSQLPFSWQSVDYADTNCLATSGLHATPDLTNQFSPTYPAIAYSGSTFISGLMGASSSQTNIWQEGIQQTVSGFCIGCVYMVNFFQAVVKQNNALDTSGCWSVYIDNSLAGISTPTISNSPLRQISLNWEFRNINFIATSTTHTIKFLPTDDDIFWQLSPVLNGGIRMGIDSIFITPVTLLPINLISFSASTKNDAVLFNWSTATEINNNFFTIEKSYNSKEWNEIIKIAGAGNSSSIRNYESVDFHPYNGISYYRLKQTDYDGKFTLSKNICVFLSEIDDIRVFPNPANEYFTVNVRETFNLRFSLFNSNNKLPLNYSIDSDKYIFDVSDLKNGIYFLLIEQDGVLLKKEKLVIQ